MERMVQCVRNNFLAREDFIELADAQNRARVWCADGPGCAFTAPHGAQPAAVFTDREAEHS